MNRPNISVQVSPLEAGEKLAEGSFSLRGVHEELSRILIRATSGNAGRSPGR